MVRGCKKNMIKLQRPGSRFFEEAYFILREDAPEGTERDMVTEANRILERSLLSGLRERKKVRLLPYFCFLFGGMLLGGGVAFLVFFLFL